MQDKLNNKWGTVPKQPNIIVGAHPAQRYRQRIEKIMEPRPVIVEIVCNGAVMLERGGNLYIVSQDHQMIIPCVHHPEQETMVVRTILTKEMSVFWGKKTKKKNGKC